MEPVIVCEYGLWYWWDESFVVKHGPYRSKVEAEVALWRHHEEMSQEPMVEELPF